MECSLRMTGKAFRGYKTARKQAILSKWANSGLVSTQFIISQVSLCGFSQNNVVTTVLCVHLFACVMGVLFHFLSEYVCVSECGDGGGCGDVGGDKCYAYVSCKQEKLL